MEAQLTGILLFGIDMASFKETLVVRTMADSISKVFESSQAKVSNVSKTNQAYRDHLT